MKNVKANIAFALGYWMLYCGLAQGGAFALKPWAALQGEPVPEGAAVPPPGVTGPIYA